MVSHYRIRVFSLHGIVENGMRIQEKLVVPLAYSAAGRADAVLVHVDQENSDVPALRPFMEANEGSCWCTVYQPVCQGCPLAAT